MTHNSSQENELPHKNISEGGKILSSPQTAEEYKGN